MVDSARVLWVDLRLDPAIEGSWQQLARGHAVQRVLRAAALEQAIAAQRPHVIVFEYDLPDCARLAALQTTKLRHPSTPLIMLTEQHNESLAVWAFRSRVWDYLVQPVDHGALSEQITRLAQVTAWRDATGRRNNACPPPPLPRSSCPVRRGARLVTAPALALLESQYHEKVTLEAAAALCRISRSEFSRTFRREHGTTFCDFLLRLRITKAQELLAWPAMPISDVAHAVGFNDLSYFTRVFRRYTGSTASAWREQPPALAKAA